MFRYIKSTDFITQKISPLLRACQTQNSAEEILSYYDYVACKVPFQDLKRLGWIEMVSKSAQIGSLRHNLNIIHTRSV